MIWILRALFGATLVAILGATIKASSQESLLAIPKPVQQDPWFQATLVDAYLGFSLFYAWVFYRERSWASRAIWFVLIMLGGNIATAAYGLMAFSKTPPSGRWQDVLLRPEPREKALEA